MNKIGISAAIIILLAVLVVASFNTLLVKANNENTSIELANSSINQAFISALDAEKAGANVTRLLLKLNKAGELLAEAENAYLSGNLTIVISKAESAILLAEEVNDDALRLRDVALVESQNNYWLTLVFSVVGAFAFSIALLIVWRQFKRARINNLGYEPEVVEDAS